MAVNGKTWTVSRVLVPAWVSCGPRRGQYKTFTIYRLARNSLQLDELTCCIRSYGTMDVVVATNSTVDL